MKRVRNMLLLTFWMLAFVSSSHSQEVIASSGGEIKTPGYVINWTLGELVTLTMQNEEFVLTEGFNQPEMDIQPIPTLSQWGLIILCLLLTIVGTAKIKMTMEEMGSKG